MSTAPASTSQVGATGRRVLLGAVVVTIVLYVVPGGDLIARPLLWLSTLVHELGHAAVTTLVGGEVVSVYVFADGSGVTTGLRPDGRLAAAAVAAGGLLGPAAVAAVVFALSREARRARIAAGVLGVVLLATIPFALRGVLAIVLALLLGGTLVALAARASAGRTQVVVVFLAVQLALSVFSRGDYLFTPTAQTATGTHQSDSGQIAAALIGPYWVWGAVCGLLSIVVLAVGLVTFLHRAGRTSSA
jgi:hypothetical protein